MKDKSIRDTAIITITLIGGLFLLQKCSGDEVKTLKRDIKISQTKGHSQKDTLQEGTEKNSLVDNSYIKRDNEIVLASYKSASNTNYTKEKHIIETKNNDSNSSQIIVSTSKDIKKTVEIDNLKDSNKTIQILVPKVVSVKDNNVTKEVDNNTTEVTDNNVTKEIDSNTTEVTDNNVTKEIDSNTTEVKDNNITKEVDNNQQIHELKEKINTALYNSDNLKDEVNKLKEELTLSKTDLATQKAKLEDMVKSLEQNITAQIDEKAQLTDRIDKLKATVVKMLTIAKEKIEEASVEYNTTIQNFLSEQQNLEQNLSVELEKEKALEDEKAKLENMIKLLEQNIATQINEKGHFFNKINELKSTIDGFETTSKEKMAEVTQEFTSKLEKLKSQKLSIEQNLSAKLENEKALADEKAKLEDMVKSLEDNITAQTDEKAQLVAKVDELNATIANMSTTAKDDIEKTTQEFNSKLEELKSQKVSIEQNLSAELENEKALADEKAKLEDMVKSLEDNITVQKDEKGQLLNKVDELKTTIDSISKMAKEETQKATQEFNAKLQALEAQKASIEENLTKQTEKLQEVMDENSKQKEELIQQKANFEEQLKTKESEIEKLKIEKEKAIKKEKAKHELLKTFLLTNVQFKRDSSQLTDESKTRLDETAKKILEYPNFKYEIQGHTDKSGKEEYNIKLSTQRAEATKKYLVSKGVHEEMLITKGFGSSQPIADNKTKKGRIKNRRVIFVIRD